MSDPISIRASSFGELFDCAHRWEAKHILGIRKPASAFAHLGTAIHAGTAMFDKARMLQQDVKPADAVGRFIDTLRDPAAEVDWSTMPLKSAQAVGAPLVFSYCADFAPRYTYTAVEMTLEPLVIDCNNGVRIQLTGSMDRARVRQVSTASITTANFTAEPAYGISDLKTGRTAVSKDGKATTRGHGPQLGTYELLFEHTTGLKATLPAGIIGLSTAKDARIGVGEIRDAKVLLTGTQEQPGLIEYAADTLKSGLFRPNNQSRLCSPLYCPRWDSCRFHE